MQKACLREYLEGECLSLKLNGWCNFEHKNKKKVEGVKEMSFIERCPLCTLPQPCETHFPLIGEQVTKFVLSFACSFEDLEEECLKKVQRHEIIGIIKPVDKEKKKQNKNQDLLLAKIPIYACVLKVRIDIKMVLVAFIQDISEFKKLSLSSKELKEKKNMKEWAKKSVPFKNVFRLRSKIYQNQNVLVNILSP
eukprot:snap_masked-scaffold_4-processed-gene-6.33-mRNA-1 protein AED:1.00 eAED:1.00 QI:0/-1/0/0/-1/1/1/0/193